MINRIYFLLLLVFIPSISFPQKLFTGSGIRTNYFIKNEGQIVNENGNVNSDVKYIYKDGAFNLELKANGFSYEIFKVTEWGPKLSEDVLQSSDDKNNESDIHKNARLQSSRIDISFSNSNSNVVIEESGELESYFNYYRAPLATNSFLHVPAFKRITYKNLYDGIDFVLYAPDKNEVSQLRYEFIVHPYADYSKINFLYSGVQQLYKNKDGSLLASTSLGFVSESKPYFMVEGNEEKVAANFVIKKNSKSFSSFQYNKNKFLIIDPNILWGTYYGGAGGDEISEVTVGTDLKPAIDGQTVSQYHIATTNGYQNDYGGGLYDWFVAKFNTKGDLEWGTYFGGDDKDYCYGITADPMNNLIAVGNSQSQGLATAGAYKDSVTGPDADILIAKFSPSGSLIWSTYYGGSDAENPRNVVADFKGDLYLAGATASDTGLASINAFQKTKGGYDDTWIAKFSVNGNRLWGTYYGDSGVDRSHAVALDLFGHLYVGGTTSSKKGIASATTQQIVYGGGVADAYISKWDTTGNFIWGSYCGGTEEERCRGIETDSAGYIYLSGFTGSDTLIATPDGFQPKWSQGYLGNTPTTDAFLVKYSSQGIRQFGTYYGGTKDESMWGITIDKANHSIFLAGSTASLTNIAYYNPMQSSNAGYADCFLAKFKTDGSLEWGTYYGGKGSEQFEDVAIDVEHNVYACGRVSSNSMMVTTETYQQYFFGGYSDAILYKFYPEFDCYDAYEPNESISQATPLKPYLVTDSMIYGYNGNISNANDNDFYSVVLDTLHNMRIILSAATKNYDLNLYDEMGVLLFQSNNPGLVADTITVNNLPSGTFYFEIPHLISDYDSLHCYRIQVLLKDTAFLGGDVYDAINDATNPISFSVYPNPAKDFLNFEMQSSNSATEILIYDLCGRIVITKTIQKNTNQQMQHLSIAELSGGPYTIIQKSAEITMVSKFVKE